MSPPARRTVRLVTGVYTLLLAVASLLPSGKDVLGNWDSEIDPTWQNWLHLPAYAGLVVLVVLSLSASRKVGVRELVCVAAACCAFGVSLELAQVVIPGRTASVTDALINVAGAIFGFPVAAWLCKRLATNTDVGNRGATDEQ